MVTAEGMQESDAKFALLKVSKKRMRDKLLYDTEDTESDYESDEEQREKR